MMAREYIFEAFLMKSKTREVLVFILNSTSLTIKSNLVMILIYEENSFISVSFQDNV